MEAANNLIKEFCQSIGMSPLGLDEENQRSLSFDEKIIVSFIGEPNDYLVGICYIGDLAKDADARIFLEENFLADAHGTGRFALEPKSNRIVLTTRWNASRIDKEQFSNELEVYVNSALRAQEFLNKGGSNATQTQSETTSTPDANNKVEINNTLAAYQNML